MGGGGGNLRIGAIPQQYNPYEAWSGGTPLQQQPARLQQQPAPGGVGSTAWAGTHPNYNPTPGTQAWASTHPNYKPPEQPYVNRLGLGGGGGQPYDWSKGAWADSPWSQPPPLQVGQQYNPQIAGSNKGPGQ